MSQLFLTVSICLLVGFLVHFLRALGRTRLQEFFGVLVPSIPLLCAVVALSYAGRYWRFRLLLGRLGIGRMGWVDLVVWFRGFALTATPAKMGELSRVQLLHEQLGYPRKPLVHVFVAERCADVAAVVLLLVFLAPAQVLRRLQEFGAVPLLLACLVAGAASLVARNTGVRLWPDGLLQRWRHYLPSRALAHATATASLISVLVWANEALVLWLLVRVLAPDAISIPAAIAIYLLSGTAGMASSLPGGIGVNEASTVLLLGQQGVPAAIALPIAVLRRLITLWSVVALAFVVGFCPLPMQRRNRRDYF